MVKTTYPNNPRLWNNHPKHIKQTSKCKTSTFYPIEKNYNYVNINKTVKNIIANRHVSSASVTYGIKMEIQIDYWFLLFLRWLRNKLQVRMLKLWTRLTSRLTISYEKDINLSDLWTTKRLKLVIIVPN